MTDALPEFQRDLERLAQKYSLLKVEEAVDALRIKPGQAFFPRPDEVAEEIERQMNASWAEAEIRRTRKMLDVMEAEAKKCTAEQREWREKGQYDGNAVKPTDGSTKNAES
jgi:hypothetical protein